MSSFKNFRIWVGWFMYKYPWLSLLFSLLFFGIGILGLLAFRGSNLTLAIVFLAGGLIVYMLPPIFSLCYSDSSDNWRIAIEDALKFLKKHPVYKVRIESFIRHTKDAKNGKEMNGWMKSYERLPIVKKKLQKLEDEQKKLPVQIEKEKEEIRDLELKLGHC